MAKNRRCPNCGKKAVVWNADDKTLRCFNCGEVRKGEGTSNKPRPRDRPG